MSKTKVLKITGLQKYWFEMYHDIDFRVAFASRDWTLYLGRALKVTYFALFHEQLVI